MSDFNRTVLLGRLTRDVEMKYTQGGTAVAEVSMAINEKRKDKNTGDMIEEVSFIDVTLWGRNAEIASEYVDRGSLLLVEGKLKQDRWEQDGQKRSKVKVVADRVVLMPKGGNAYSEPVSSRQEEPVGVTAGGDEVPF